MRLFHYIKKGLYKALWHVDVIGLADRLCLAYGDFENIVCVDHTVYDPFVIGDEHRVGVVIATVEPLLDTVRFQVLKMRTCFLSLTAIELSISTIYPKSHFCTKRYKRLDFQGFLAFLSRSHGRLIKKTVNSRLKNANLCLRFGWVHFILTNHFCGECLFFVFSRSIFGFR